MNTGALGAAADASRHGSYDGPAVGGRCRIAVGAKVWSYALSLAANTVLPLKSAPTIMQWKV